MRTFEPIAIVGIGCRFATATGPSDLWELLCSGRDAVEGGFDDRRLDIHGDTDAEWVRRLKALPAGTLRDIDQFDAAAFNISAREARLMDPQQRLMLEAVWEALDDAGQDARRLEGRRVGVYTGIYGTDYQSRLFRHFPDVDVGLTTGASAYALAGRVSYVFGFHGPSFTIETACSASLVAIHEACTALGTGECELALAGGVNLLLDPTITLAYLNSGALSPDGRCRFGDASGNGYVRAEGVGMIALKTLHQARRDGDPIYAVIRSSVSSHTGRTGSSLFEPSEQSQVMLLKEALARAGKTPADLDLIEAHGTGTKVGDRIELNAVSATLRSDEGGRTSPCLVGSVKTNIGHMESAAGVAGVIKAALCLRHRQVPPNLHFHTPHPDVPWDDRLFRIPTALTAIAEDDRPATAAVSSFGITGTIACVILESAPSGPVPTGRASPAPPAEVPFVLPLSARTPEALRRYAGAVGAQLRGGLVNAADLAFSAALRRSHHDVRLAAIGTTADELAEALATFEHGEPGPTLRASALPVVSAPKIGWAFCGQGPQWAGMGMDLYAAEPAFRAKMDELDALIRAEVGISVIDEIRAEDAASRLNRTDFTQPAIFAVQVALAELLASWGLAPSMIVGHSVGEVAAALVAGVLPPEDAVRVICARGRVAEKAAGWGKMAACELGIEEAEAIAAESGGGINVAAINGPSSITFAGLREPMEDLCRRFAEAGRFARMLDVDYPSHCALLDPLVPEMAAACVDVRANAPSVRLYSTVLGREAEVSDFTPDYWSRNLRETVRFAPTVKAMADAGCDLFVEISPHPALSFSIRQVLAASGSDAGVVETMRRGEDARVAMRVAIGEHYVRGAEPDWSALAPAHGSPVPLPPYPWDHERYWIEEAPIAEHAFQRVDHAAPSSHALLQRRLDILGAGGASYWQSEVSLARLPWIADHVVRGRATFPAAGYLVAMLAAGDELSPGSSLADVELHEALSVPDSGAVRLQFGLLPDTTSPGAFRIAVDAAPPDHPESARTHVTARLLPAQEAFNARREHPRNAGTAVERAAFYEAMARARLDYGARFQGVESLAMDGFRAVAALRPAPRDAALPGLHPATIDACLQALLALTPGWGRSGDLWLPQAIKRVRRRARIEAADGLTALAVGIPSLLGQDFMGDVVLLDADGQVLLSMEGVRFHKVAAAEADTSLLHELRWVSRAPAPRASERGRFDPQRMIAVVAEAGPTTGERAAIGSVRDAADRLGGLSVRHAFLELGFDFTPGRHVTLADIARDTGIVPLHHRLLGRLVAILREDGILQADGDGWRVLEVPRAIDLAAEFDAAIASAEPNVLAFWRIFARASLNLAPMLSGRLETAELLFGGEGAVLLQELYAEHLFWRAPIRQLATAVGSFVEQHPAGATLRVLEVGAGTGGVTSHLLPLLPKDGTHYVFTDLSPYFFGPAQARFEAYSFLSPRLLDIERDPLTQEFEAASFDVVVAANCLHATADLRRSLAHAALLLRPGGLLMLQEETARERWTDLIFGLTEGWWRFRDEALRPDHALLATEGWTDILDACGFDHVSIFGGEEDAPSGAVAIVARKRPAAEARPWLLLADEGDVATRLARCLAEAGQPCRPVHAPAADEAVRALLAEPDAPGQVIVDLRPLDACLADDDDPDALARVEGRALDRMLGLLHALLDGGRRHPPRLVVVTAGSQATGDDQGPVAMAQSTLWTVVRNAVLENPGLPISAIDLDARLDADGIDGFASELLASDGEPEVALRRGRRRVRRLFRWDQADADQRRLPAGPFALEVSRRGVLDGFEAVATTPEPPKADEVQIRVRAAGVNFHDLMNLLGAVTKSPLGFECVGVVSAVGKDVDDFAVGDEVVAVALGTWRSHVNTPAVLAAPKPAGIGHEAAAGLPIVYLTAHYALRHLAHVRAGQRVLIHSAAGGFGLASLHIARSAGARVVATAGTEAKRDYLRAAGAVQALDSRSLRFAADIDRSEDGAVDIVVNSLAGDFIPASLDLLAEGGTFIEVGKQNIWTREQVSARRPDVNYHTVDLEGVMRRSPEELAGMLPRIVSDLEQGVLPALPIRAFPISRAVEALRFMQEARQTGKIVLSVPPAADPPIGLGASLITGGLGGLGLATARWLADKGERRLILVGRNAPNATATTAIDELRARGVEVWTERCDLGEHAEVARLIDRCGGDLPPLKSVFHLAGLLDDAPVHQLDTARFLAVYRPKVLGAWSLHRLTEKMPLERFVLFSSWTAVLGSPAQANHASANAFLDALAHHRRARGLPAQSINWGGWSETGSAADPGRLAHLARQGLGAMTNAVALDALKQILSSDAIQVAVSPFDPSAWRMIAAKAPGAVVVSELDAPPPEVPVVAVESEAAPAHERSLRDALAELTAGPARRNLLESWIVNRLSQVLRTPARGLDVRKPFKSLGLDSLTALELRNALELDTKLKLPASLIFNHASITKLATELAAQMSVPLDAEPAPSPIRPEEAEDDDAALLDALRALPEDEALRLLASEGALPD